jgi:hypothetical protein
VAVVLECLAQLGYDVEMPARATGLRRDDLEDPDALEMTTAIMMAALQARNRRAGEFRARCRFHWMVGFRSSM